MSNKADRRKRAWRYLTLFMMVIVGIPLLLLCLGTIWFFARQSVASEQLIERVEQLREQGECVDLPSLRAAYEDATSQENEKDWVTVCERLESDDLLVAAQQMPFFDETDVPAPGTDWPGRDHVVAFLNQWEAELDELQSLAIGELENDKPTRRPLVFTHNEIMSAPKTQELQGLAKMLRLRHAAAVYDHDHAGAMRCIRACQGLSHMTRCEPVFTGQASGISVARDVNRMIQLSLRYDQLSDAQMGLLIATLEDYSQLHARYRRSMKGEIAAMLPVFMDPVAFRAVAGQDVSNAYLKTRARDALYYLNQIELCINAPSESPQVLRDAVGEIMDQFDAQPSGLSGLYAATEHSVANLLMPAANARANAVVLQLEHNRLTVLAMNVRKYQRRFGSWPDDLSMLTNIDVDPEALSPVIGSEFGYMVAPGGDRATLWGIDRSDQNPIPETPPPTTGSEARSADWVWLLDRP